MSDQNLTVAGFWYLSVVVTSFTSMENGGRGSTTISSTNCWRRVEPSRPSTTWKRLHLGPYLVPRSAALIQARKDFTERSNNQTRDRVTVVAADVP